MMSTKTLRLLFLLVPMCTLTACDENPVQPPVCVDCPPPPECPPKCPPPPLPVAKFLFQGDKVAVLAPGRAYTLEYFVWESEGAPIDVSVVEAPKRSTYKITDTEEDSAEIAGSGKNDVGIPKKKITIFWTPNTAAEGTYPLTLWASTKVGSAERFFHLELVVQSLVDGP